MIVSTSAFFVFFSLVLSDETAIYSSFPVSQSLSPSFFYFLLLVSFSNQQQPLHLGPSSAKPLVRFLAPANIIASKTLNSHPTMPYVGDDVHRATKRKWDLDGTEAFRLSHSAIHVLNQHAAPESADAISTRKTLPPTKRFRPIHDDDNAHALSSHRRNTSRELAQGVHGKAPVKINGMVLMPCHVCHRRPTKKSDLDSFARCQSCQEQTCFVCMRECQGQNFNQRLVLEAEDALSRSFHMDDVDDCMTPPIPDANAQKDNDNNDSDRRQGMSGCSTHHAMICSRCCVEKGAQGEVVCLGCLSDTYAA